MSAAAVYPEGSVEYQPYGACLTLFRSFDREIILSGPAGTGKSRACLEKLHACMVKYPGSRGLIVRQTRASLSDSALTTFEKDVINRGSSLLAGPGRDNRKHYKYPNGSEITVAGISADGSDDDMRRLMSTEFHMIFGQEWIEVSEESHQMLMTRLRAPYVEGKNGRPGRGMPYRQFIADTNPGAPTHWIKNREAAGHLTLLNTSHTDNPIYFDQVKKEYTPLGDEYLAGLATNTGHIKDRMLYGRWVAVEGARFTQLDDKIHRFRFYEKWPHGLPHLNIIMGVDWGTAVPYCALWIAVDHEKNLYVLREDYRKGITTDVQPKEIIKLTKANEIISKIYADPAMWAHPQSHTGQTQKSSADYYIDAFYEENERAIKAGEPSRFGPFLRGFNKSRRIAENTVDAILNRGNNYPNLYIEEGCKNLWDELMGAVWDKDSRGSNNEQMDPRCADHAITALYYAAHTYIQAPEGVTLSSLPTPEEIHAIRERERDSNARRQFANRQRLRV